MLAQISKALRNVSAVQLFSVPSSQHSSREPETGQAVPASDAEPSPAVGCGTPGATVPGAREELTRSHRSESQVGFFGTMPLLAQYATKDL